MFYNFFQVVGEVHVLFTVSIIFTLWFVIRFPLKNIESGPAWMVYGPFGCQSSDLFFSLYLLFSEFFFLLLFLKLNAWSNPIIMTIIMVIIIMIILTILIENYQWFDMSTLSSPWLPKLNFWKYFWILLNLLQNLFFSLISTHVLTGVIPSFYRLACCCCLLVTVKITRFSRWLPEFQMLKWKLAFLRFSYI